jgi:hypothetical protein
VVNFSIGAWAGSPFRTDNQPWTLTSATVTLELGATNSSIANVRLMSDAGGKPGASLADLGTKTVRTGSELYVFSTTNSVSLAANTAYWIVVGNVSTNGGLNVGLSVPGEAFTFTGVAGASITNSISAGSSASENPPAAWGQAASGISLLFAVEGSRVGPATTPQLAISQPSLTNAVVSWPASFTGYTLQYATNLPATVWTSTTNAPAVVNGQFVQQVNTAGPVQFYRLMK